MQVMQRRYPRMFCIGRMVRCGLFHTTVSTSHKKPDKIRVFQGNGLKRVKACATISVKNECAVQQSELDQTVQQSKLDQTNQEYATKLGFRESFE